MPTKTLGTAPERQTFGSTGELTPGLISVLIPAYNHEKYVQETIRSIIAQSYQNIELLIVDDGSTDATYAKIQEMEPECRERFARVVIKTQDNRGSGMTLNRLVTLSRGEYLYMIASDDMAKPSAFETLQRFLHEHPDYVLAVSDNEFINSNGVRFLAAGNIGGQSIYFDTFGATLQFDLPHINFFSSDFGAFQHLVMANHVPNGYLLRHSAVRQLAPFTPDAPLEDYYLMLQLCLKGKFKYFDEELFCYRRHSANTSSNVAKMVAMTEKTRAYVLKMLDIDGAS